jgi:hypothetical protein
MSMIIGDLFARLFLAGIGLGWFAYNAQKLGNWLKNGQTRAPVSFWIMVPYRTACMAFGALWMTYVLVAGTPGIGEFVHTRASHSTAVR